MSASSCVLCNQPAFLMCQRCRDTYCSIVCQAIDWPKHKATCILMPSLIPFVDPKQALSTGQFKSVSTTLPIKKGTDEYFGKIGKNISQVVKNMDNLTLNIAKDVNSDPKFAIFNDRAGKPADISAIGQKNIIGSKESFESLKQPDCKIKNDSYSYNSFKNAVCNQQPIQKMERHVTVNEPIFNRSKSVENPVHDSASVSQRLVRHNSVNDRLSNPAPNPVPIQSLALPTANLVASNPVPIRNLALPTANPVAPNPVPIQSLALPTANPVPIQSPALPTAHPVAPNPVPIQAPVLSVAKEEVPNLNKFEKPVPEPPTSTTTQKKTQSLRDVKTGSISNWKNPFLIENNTLDVIVHFIDPSNGNLWLMDATKESACNKLLREINKLLTKKTPPIEPAELKVGCLVAAPYEEVYYRALVLEIIDNFKDVFVQLIDYGNTFYVKADLLKSPIPIMNNLHAFVFHAKMSVPRPIEIMDKIRVTILAKQLNGIYLIKEENKITKEINEVVDAYVEAESCEVFTKDNLIMIPIPEAPNSKIYCLDSSTIADGFITACTLDVKLIQKVEEYADKIQEYCRNSTQEFHKPQSGELCLAIFEEDGNWYRAECLKELPNEQYLLRFIDYGNMINCNKTAIRRLGKELLFPCLAQTCVISIDFPNNTENIVEKLEKFFDEQVSIDIDVAKKIDGEYVIVISNLAEILQQ